MTKQSIATLAECLACHKPASPVARVAERPVLRCQSCELHFCPPEISVEAAESAGRVSSETSADYTARLLTESRDEQERADGIANRRANEFLSRISQGSALLEVGAGTGIFEAGYTQSGLQYTGIDVDKRVVEAGLMRERNLTCIDFIDFEPGRQFDIIVASQVFEHFGSPDAFLDKALDLLRPGGLLHLDIPNHRSLAGAPSRLTKFGRASRFGAIEPPHHMMGYNEKALRNVLASWSEVEVFPTTALHETWGQIRALGKGLQLYINLSRISRSEGMLVSLARKPTTN